MRNDDVMPVNHTPGSEFATKATGTVGGAVKGGLGAMLLWIGAAALIGIGIAAMFTGPAGTGFGLDMIGKGVGSLLTNGLFWGGVIGAGAGIYTSWIPGGIGAIFGGLKGHERASNRVNNERAAAMEMQQAIAMQQAPTMEAGPNKYNFPAQGSAMNPAGTKIGAMEYDGLAAGQQLQRA